MEIILSKNIIETALRLNKLALIATEKAVIKSIKNAEDLQIQTSKTLKNSLTFSGKQQNNLFNILERRKKMIWRKLNKL